MKFDIEKVTTPIAILGVIILAGIAIFVYGANGIDVTTNAITGLLGFAGGVVTSAVSSKDGKADD